MKKRFLPVIICWTVLLPLLHSTGAQETELPPGDAHEKVQTGKSGLPLNEFALLRVPFFSPHFADTPVALVNEEPITVREMTGPIGYQHQQVSEGATESKKDYLSILNRLIDSRLIVEEAINIGLGETNSYKQAVESYKLKTLQKELIANALSGLEPDPAEVERQYKDISLEAKIYSLTFGALEDANRFRSDLQDGDFDQLAKKYVMEGKAKESGADEYVKLNDLMPQVAQLVNSSDVGSVSNLFKTEEGVLLFKLLDKRFVEDPSAEQKAFSMVFAIQRKEKAKEYGKALEDKYVTFDKALYDQLNFDENYEQLKDDQRVLATVKGDEPVTIKVADLAAQLEKASFHGADKAQQLKILNEKKEIALANMLFTATSKIEAHRLGMDQTEDYKRKVEEFERSKLYEAFVNKLILPDARLTQEEVLSYYDEHASEYESPEMLRMTSLVFTAREDAESSLNKLRKGADYNWVSANATNLVPDDAEGPLSLDRNILSLNTLPEDLQQEARGRKKGDSFLYAPSDGTFYYVLSVTNTFPPVPQPFEEVKEDVANIVYRVKVEKLLEDWLAKLRAAYPVQVFLIDSKE
ncbi:MAG: peptidyl-prolyl cis-trans isomerase [Desulfobulbaceae bacterium]|nr:peptidyl-prolyl cis-trans isomerase [Desulfobulbaceae bacterium]